jgi:hypothetical protein
MLKTIKINGSRRKTKMTFAIKLKIQSAGKVANLALNSASSDDMDRVISLLSVLFDIPFNDNFQVEGADLAPVIEPLPLVKTIAAHFRPQKLTDVEPEFYKTGIKVDEDGTKRYKCRYTCRCGKRGNHYIPLRTEEVCCHECGEVLDVLLATGGVNASGIPERDDFGNFYFAD